MSKTHWQSPEGRAEIMTIEEVAAYLRLKPQTIYKWAQEKRIPAAKLGKEWRFRRSILDAWLNSQMIGDESGFEYLRQVIDPDNPNEVQ